MPPCQLVDRLAAALDLLLRRPRPDVRACPSAASSTVRTCNPGSRTFSRGTRQTRVLVSFTVSCSRPIIFRIAAIALCGGAAAADHEVIGVVDDVGVQTRSRAPVSSSPARTDACTDWPAAARSERLAACRAPRPCCGSFAVFARGRRFLPPALSSHILIRCSSTLVASIATRHATSSVPRAGCCRSTRSGPRPPPPYALRFSSPWTCFTASNASCSGR